MGAQKGEREAGRGTGTFCLGSSAPRGEETPFVPGTGLLLLPCVGRASGEPDLAFYVNSRAFNEDPVDARVTEAQQWVDSSDSDRNLGAQHFRPQKYRGNSTCFLQQPKEPATLNEALQKLWQPVVP